MSVVADLHPLSQGRCIHSAFGLLQEVYSCSCKQQACGLHPGRQEPARSTAGSGPEGIKSCQSSMCGSAGPAGVAFEASMTGMILRRNISNSSSNFANNGLAAAHATKDTADCMRTHHSGDDRVAQPDVMGRDCSMPNSLNDTLLTDSSYISVEQAEPTLPPTQQLLLGTSAGLFLVDPVTQNIQLLGLQDCTVGHISYFNDQVLASCPVIDFSDLDLQQQHAAIAAAGLYSIKISSTNPSSSRSPFDRGIQIQKLWQGDARCSAVSAPANQCSTTPRVYLGTQPADLLYSDDMGQTWNSTGLSGAQGSQQWFCRTPPYEPCVRSICSSRCDSPRGSSGSSSSWGDSSSRQEQPVLLVGVEVGGVYSFSHPSTSPAAVTAEQPALSSATLSSQPPLVAAAAGTATVAAAASSSQSSWEESNLGLCKDIQALQPDPWNSQRLYAVAGSGSMPGGLYRSRGKGRKWKRLFGYRYSAGMAISSYQKGRLLLLSADKPPEIGCSIFESLDSGRHWVNITDELSDALLPLSEYATGLLEHTPVCMYVPGGLVVACVTGHVFRGQALPTGGYGDWQLLAKLPAAVHCICLTDESVAPAAISRL